MFLDLSLRGTSIVSLNLKNFYKEMTEGFACRFWGNLRSPLGEKL
jgi:hypothetical protein